MKEITYKVIFPDDYNTVYATGVWGSLQGSGDVCMHFYQDRAPVPRKVLTEYDDQGKRVKELKVEPEAEDLMIRYITAGVTMKIGDAIALHDWLGRMIEAHAKMSKQPEDAQDGAASH